MQVVLLTCSTTVAQLGFKRKATAVLKSNLVRSMAIFIVKTHYPSEKLEKIFCCSSGLCVSSINTGTRRIMRPDELPFVVRRSRRISN